MVAKEPWRNPKDKNMEASSEPEIVIKLLEKFGVSVPKSVSRLEDVTSKTLVSICSQSLELLGHKGCSFLVPPSDPLVSVADDLKICDEMALALKDLGYSSELDGYKFLYPSEEESYRLLRFLVDMLSEFSEGLNGGVESGSKSNAEEVSDKLPDDRMLNADNEGVDLNMLKVEAILKDLKFETQVPRSSYSVSEYASLADDQSHTAETFLKDELFDDIRGKHSAAGTEFSGISTFYDAADQNDDRHFFTSNQLKEHYLEMEHEAQKLWEEEKKLKEELNAKTLELQQVEEELKWLKIAAEKAIDEHHIDYHVEQLSEQVDAQKQKIRELESKWDSFASPLEERKRSLMESLYADIPEGRERLQKLEDLEKQTQSIFFEIKQREDEYSKVLKVLHKQPEVASRRSHVDRIKEITRNSRKLDGDIEQILRETRELQLESNSIQERLSRTHAVVDEIVFREAKRDPVGRQAYRLLTSIHENFDQISEKILTSDRIRREVSEYEKKLAAINGRSLNGDKDKLQADSDFMKKENNQLQD